MKYKKFKITFDFEHGNFVTCYYVRYRDGSFDSHAFSISALVSEETMNHQGNRKRKVKEAWKEWWVKEFGWWYHEV